MSDVAIIPGKELSPEDKAKLAKENERETIQAQQMASEQRQRDAASGVKPVLSSIAESVKAKLERDEFSVAVDESGHQVPPRP